MRVSPAQLTDHCKRPLLSVYLLGGEEPLQFGEALTTIRTAAQRAGFTERQVLEYQKDFDWNLLFTTANARSLFAAQQMIELRLGAQKIGVEGANAIRRYCDQPVPDVLLLITALGMEWKDFKAKWVQRIEEIGVVTHVRAPQNGATLLKWLEQRLRSHGFIPTPAVVDFLAAQTEGNLLAAHQEITKLALLRSPGALDIAELRAAITDSARFDIYDLSQAALAGDRARTQRVLQVLIAEDTATSLVLWVLAREIRVLAALAFAQQARQDLTAVFNAHQVWDSRREEVLTAVKRYSLPTLWQLLLTCAQTDRVIKGMARGDAWALLTAIADGLAAPTALFMPSYSALS